MVDALKSAKKPILHESVNRCQETYVAILLNGTEVVELSDGALKWPGFLGWNLHVGSDFANCTCPSQPLFLAAIDTANRTGESVSVTSNSLEFEVLPVDDGHGKILSLLVLTPNPGVESISDQRSANLEPNRESLLTQSGVGIIEFDSQHPEWCFTDHLETLLGLPTRELDSKRALFRERIHKHDLDVDICCSEHKAAKYEVRLRDATGIYRWFAISIQDNKDNGQNCTKKIGTIVDIDHLKNAQLNSDRQVERRDQFLAVLSHELRNPLMAIRYSVDLLADFNQARTSSREFLSIIARQTSQMSRILDDLLDVSHIVQNRLEFDMANHDFNSAVRDVVETVRSSIVDKQQTIHVDLCEEKLFVNGDTTRIKQAIINVLENASKFTDQGGKLKIRTSIAGDEVCVEVADTGVGISSEHQEKIFELFFHDHSQDCNKQSRGMGVGLFLVKSVIEKHNGRVTVTSHGKNCGSAFSIYLPLVQKIANETITLTTECSNGRKTVCLIEDIADSRIALKILLEHRGFDVFEFADAESALERIPEIRPDAAIIDIGLPGKSGLEVAAEIRNEHGMNDMLLIALTGYGQEADCKDIDQVGFNQHLIKPAGIRKVCEALSEFFKTPKKAA